MADNFLERQYAAYEEKKKNLGKPKKKSSVQFYTRPGKVNPNGNLNPEGDVTRGNNPNENLNH